MMTRAKIQ